jgi:SAM-dependent methyltransferase
MNSYLKLCTQLYDIDKPQAPAAALAFYRRYALAARGPILEPMCGSGRFLIPLLESGFEVDGTDASTHMLASCRSRCEARGLSPALYQQYLHELELPRRYGLIFIASSSLSLLIEPDQIRLSLRKLRAALQPGGRLVLEVERVKEEQATHEWPWSSGRRVDRPDGARILSSWQGRYDAAQRISYSLGRYELVKDGRLLETEIEDFNLRFYSAAEFGDLLRAAGFGDVRLLGDFGDGSSEPGDGSLLFEAAKTG